jgi:hypothetical protein
VNRKKTIIICSITAVVSAGCVLFLLIHFSLEVPELIGTWKLDPDATLAFNKDRPEVDHEELQMQVEDLSRLNTHVIFKRNNEMIYELLYVPTDPGSTGDNFQIELIEKSQNSYSLGVEFIGEGNKIPFLREKGFSTVYTVTVISKNKLIAIHRDPEEYWLVYKKVE